MIGLLQGRAQLPPVEELERLADVDVLAIGAVEGEQVVDEGTFRKAARVGDGRGVGQFMIAPAKEVYIGDKIILAGRGPPT